MEMSQRWKNKEHLLAYLEYIDIRYKQIKLVGIH